MLNVYNFMVSILFVLSESRIYIDHYLSPFSTCFQVFRFLGKCPVRSSSDILLCPSSVMLPESSTQIVNTIYIGYFQSTRIKFHTSVDL